MTIAAAALMALSAQPAQAGFLKSLIREGAAQLKQAGRQEAQAAVQKAVTAVQQGVGNAGQPRADRQPTPQAEGELQPEIERATPSETASKGTDREGAPRR